MRKLTAKQGGTHHGIVLSRAQSHDSKTGQAHREVSKKFRTNNRKIVTVDMAFIGICPLKLLASIDEIPKG
jgi:hypothetical protein